MRTVGEIKNEIEKLDVMRLKNIDIRDTEKDECKREVARNIVLIASMQMEKLQWVLNESV